ncbi:MAG: hypothetical protein Q9O62_13360 [Ardenticatenia bacterium]|nr:hypothetical protein [Ardenticatenia bacterium]
MLTWTGIGPVLDDYNVFTHLVGPDGRQVAQDDGPPVDGAMPTWLFGPGEYPDEHTIRVPEDLPAGRYRLRVGLYNLETLARLPVLDESGRPSGDEWTVDFIWVGARPPLPPRAHRGDIRRPGDSYGPRQSTRTAANGRCAPREACMAG